MTKYAQHVANTGQKEPALGVAMEKNAAGGYVFAIDDWKMLRRFLILGCEGGTFYEGEREMTLSNAECVLRCLKEDGARTINEIVEISDKGLAIKNDSAIFALALAATKGNDATRKLAFEALPKVCRIGTHLFQFVDAREAIDGGWGRGMRKAVGNWFNRPDVVMQALKYQQRGGWAHRDLLRLAHPKKGENAAIFDAICRPGKWADVKHPLAEAYLKAQTAVSASEVAGIIAEYNLPREFVPTQFLTDPAVWGALLPSMGLTAMIRNLGNMSKCGLLVPMSDASKTVTAKLADEAAIKKARVHPFAILLAARTYSAGRGVLGKGEWKVVPQVVDALDRAFDLAFQNVQPTGKRHLLGVDVSGSMSMGFGGGPMSAAEAAAAMALVTARTEPNYYVMGFATAFVDLKISAKDSLPTVLKKTRDHNFGGTDTSVAVAWALKNKVPVDVFGIYSDGETWAGDQHTFKAMEQYRKQTGIPARLAVVNFTSTRHSIADQRDPLSMDFVGMDASLPQALAAFVGE